MREQGGCGHRSWDYGQTDTEVSLAHSPRRKKTLTGEVLLLTRPGCGHRSLETEIVPAQLLLLYEAVTQ